MTVIKSYVVRINAESGDGGLSTVVTDGVTIQGDGSVSSPVAIKTGYLASKQDVLSNGSGTIINGTQIDFGGPVTVSAQLPTSDGVEVNLYTPGSEGGALNVFSNGPNTSRVMLASYQGGGAATLSFGMSAVYGNGVKFTDLRTTKVGIEYGADYSAGFTDRSLVDKAYVDSVAGGSGWAVTGNTPLTGAVVISGTSSNTIKFSFPSLGVTQTDGAGLHLQNPTAAAIGAQQISPSIVQEANGYKTNAVAGSQTIRLSTDVLPIQAAVEPGFTWRLRYSKAGAPYVNLVTAGDVLGTTGSTGLQIESATDPNGAVFNTYRNAAVPVNGDRIGEFHFYGNDSAGNATQYAAIYADSKVVTNGSETGNLLMNLTVNNALKVLFLAEANAGNDGVRLSLPSFRSDEVSNVVNLGLIGTFASCAFKYAKSTSAAAQQYAFINTAGNAGSYSELDVTNDVSHTAALSSRLIAFPALWSPVGAYKALCSVLEAGSSMTGGLSIVSSNGTTGMIRFYTDGFADANERMKIQNDGYVGIGIGSGGTATALVHIGASTTARASLCVPHGTAPSSPVNGDIWTDTSGMYVRINGVTKTITLT